jgi:hypothetical protein
MQRAAARVDRWLDENGEAWAAASRAERDELTADFSQAEHAYMRHLSEFGGLPGSKGRAFDVMSVPDEPTENAR